MIKVKICGLSCICDIEVANELLPDYIGFVFTESRRKVTLGQAFGLREKLCSEILSVGVFADAEMKDILNLTKSGTIDMIQLHGAEDEEYILRLKSLTDKSIIKAISVRKKGDVQKWNASATDYLLLDHKGGGTGVTFDWKLIGEVNKPYFLAGGLNIDNISMAINQISPFAVDVSSGMETDGYKDPVKITEFIRTVRHGN